MQAAMDAALKRAQEAKASRVYAIRLRVGQLSGVVPDALQFAFEALSNGTLAQGATLDIEHVPARFWCGTCQKEFTADDMFAECPGCHGLSLEMRSGRELELASMEIE
jgi:hydrogenase nickel incorporation protein HypA/HybF